MFQDILVLSITI